MRTRRRHISPRARTTSRHTTCDRKQASKHCGTKFKRPCRTSRRPKRSNRKATSQLQTRIKANRRRRGRVHRRTHSSTCEGILAGVGHCHNSVRQFAIGLREVLARIRASNPRSLKGFEPHGTDLTHTFIPRGAGRHDVSRGDGMVAGGSTTRNAQRTAQTPSTHQKLPPLERNTLKLSRAATTVDERLRDAHMRFLVSLWSSKVHSQRNVQESTEPIRVEEERRIRSRPPTAGGDVERIGIPNV